MLRALVVVVLVLGACFTRPELRPGDGGVTDGNGDGGDAPIDAACVPAIDPLDIQLDQLQLDHVSASYYHVCAIDTASQMWCWGSNDYGQLGARTDTPGENTGKPGLASTITGWTSVSVASDHSCGVANNKMYCWGRNDTHQSLPGGDGSDVGPEEVMLSSLLQANETPMKAFAGPFASCTITNMNRAFCWGDVNLTVAGGTPEARQMIAATNGNTTWSTIAIAEDHACAISHTNNHIYCWGKNNVLQLGVAGSDRTFAQLAERDLGNQFTSISVFTDVTCATHISGNLVCFGSSGHGHLGNVTGNDDDHVVSSGTWNRVSINNSHVCVANMANEVRCYGDDPDGALGSGLYASNRMNLGNVVTTNAAEIVTGQSVSCALDNDHHLSCWGVNSHGELGLGAVATKRDPSLSLLAVGNCDSVHQVVAGDRHTCAIVVTPPATSGRLFCWGNNQRRQVTGISMEQSKPLAIEPFPQEAFSRVATAEMHTCALRDDGSIRCWGDNSAGQLGSAGVGPVVLAPIGGIPWVYVTAGSRATCAIRMGGELFCWGDVPVVGLRNTPTNFGRVMEGVTKSWTTVSLGSGFGLGTAIDPADTSRVYIYGFAPTGCQLDEVGGTTAYPPSAPKELYPSMHGRANVTAAQASGAHLCMHMNDNDPEMTNKVTCAGNNASFQCGPIQGANSCVPYEDPPAPPGGWRTAFLGVSTVTASRTHSCALDSIGRPWCWGANNNAELGDLDSLAMMPTQVTDQRFAEIWTGADHTCGVSEERTSVSCWGQNRDGQLGDNARFHPAPTRAALVPP